MLPSPGRPGGNRERRGPRAAATRVRPNVGKVLGPRADNSREGESQRTAGPGGPAWCAAQLRAGEFHAAAGASSSGFGLNAGRCSRAQ